MFSWKDIGKSRSSHFILIGSGEAKASFLLNECCIILFKSGKQKVNFALKARYFDDFTTSLLKNAKQVHSIYSLSIQSGDGGADLLNYGQYC